MDRMDAMDGLEGLRRIVPRYPTPEGIPARTLRGWIERAVAEYADLAEGHLPDDLVRKQGLPGPAEALRQVHAPGLDVDLRDYETFASPAHRRLVLEELYLLELGLALRQRQAAALPGVAFDVGEASVRRAPEGLPFQLTDAQDRAWQEIRDDLARPHPMNRLLHTSTSKGSSVALTVEFRARALPGSLMSSTRKL